MIGSGFLRISALVGIALLAGCTNGWGSLSKVAESECGKAHDVLVRQQQAQLGQMKSLEEMSRRMFGNTQTAKDYAEAQEELAEQPSLDREKFMAACVQPLAEALAPCREHKFGSDSALLCIGRRGNPVALAAFMKSRGEPDIESAYWEAMGNDARAKPAAVKPKNSAKNSGSFKSPAPLPKSPGDRSPSASLRAPDHERGRSPHACQMAVM